MDRWTPSGAGANFKLSQILAPLEKLQALRHVVRATSRTRRNAELRAHDRAGHVAVGRAARQQAHGREHGDDDRPDDRGARSARRRRCRRSRSRPRPRRRVAACPSGGGCYYSYDAVVPQRHVAAADGVQPAQGVHAAVRRRRHARRARGDRAADAQHARPDRRAHDGAAERARRRRPACCSTTTSSTVREIERRVAEWPSSAICRASTLPEAPIGELDDFDEQVKLMFDLIALAYQANLTRVASYIMVAEGTNRTYNHIGVSGRVPSAVAPREQQGPPREAREDPDVSRASASRTSSTSSRRRRTATARCSITRCSCTART